MVNVSAQVIEESQGPLTAWRRMNQSSVVSFKTEDLEASSNMIVVDCICTVCGLTKCGEFERLQTSPAFVFILLVFRSKLRKEKCDHVQQQCVKTGFQKTLFVAQL